MSLHARARLRGINVRITRPATVRDADGTRRASASGEVELYKHERLAITPLTVERRTHVFGTSAHATWSARVPLGWTVQQDDHLTVLDGADAGERYRVEQRVDYRHRPRLQHTELALVRLAAGAA